MMQHVQTQADSSTAPIDARAAAQEILPELARHSDRSEVDRKVTAEAMAAIRKAGLSRMLAPKAMGGMELPVSQHIRSCIDLARGCPAASWVHMVCAAHTFVVGRYPQACLEEVFGSDPDVLIPGALAPQGSARKVADGWMLDGRWQFGSGVDHGPWLLLGAKAVPGEVESGIPAVHLVVPTADITVDDTWFTLGMRGTGSKDLVAENLFVPDHRVMPTRELFRGDFEGDAGPLYRLPVMGGLASMLAGTIVGMAQRGTEAFIEATRVRREVYTGAEKAARPGIQMRLSESLGEIELAEMLVMKNAALLDAAMAAGEVPLNRQSVVAIRWNASYAAELCRRATERVYAAAGAGATHDRSPLQRWFRDINTATHHAIVDFDSLREARGRFALGLPLGGPL